MMDWGYMAGGGSGTMMFFAWIIYILVILLLVFGLMALWKYINRK